MEIEIELSRIIINEAVEQQLIVLKEKAGTRQFPIVIGLNEILAIDRRIKGIELPRPMTHDLLAKIIDRTGGKIQKVLIDDLSNHTFFAKIHIQSDGQVVVIDSRPSDAIALAAGQNVPLFVAEHVLKLAGVGG